MDHEGGFGAFALGRACQLEVQESWVFHNDAHALPCHSIQVDLHGLSDL